jgi:cobalt-zinc-cadmium efflux system protein
MHDHAGEHNHDHSSTSNIRLAFFVNILFTVIEAAGGILTNSLAILSDALHDLGDSFSIGLSWYFEKVSGRQRSEAYSYGYRRFSLLGALINSVVLIAGSVLIIARAVPRIINPQPVHVPGMLMFAVAGIVVNGIAVLRLRKGRKINERVIMIHLAEDVLGWAAVLIGSIVMYFTGLTVIDPILSVAITVFVFIQIYRNIRQTLRILLQSVPSGIDSENVKNRLLMNSKIIDVHDLHLWSMDGAYNVSSLHVVVPDETGREDIISVKEWVRQCMKDLGVQHATIEVGWESEDCGLDGC